MKVAIELMNMWSAAGYRQSNGMTWAIIVPANEVIAYGDDSDALLNAKGADITEEMLSDVQHRTLHRGELTWKYTTGVLDVPDGHVVIQKEWINICTDDKPSRRAWIVNVDKSMKKLYKERAEEYARLAA